MADFDERSGIVPSKTDWGIWWQTVDEIHIEINVPPGSSSKDISCQIKSNYLKVTVKENQIIEVILMLIICSCLIVKVDLCLLIS